MTPKLALFLLVGTAAATAPPATKLQASRVVPKPVFPAKVLELRGGGVVSGDLVVKTTQVIFGGYALALLFTPGLMTTLHFDQETSPITEFWARGSAVPLLSVVYFLAQSSPEDAIKFCSVFNPLMGLIYPWNAEFITKLGGTPLHKFPTIFFALLSVAGLMAR
mmetsp:Transcript_23542/g.47859  ORF Transcript_23542/g.47859 Transcript_23542/m.47859 type:complete len:164 (+) Transcript_23542:64-555(+)